MLLRLLQTDVIAFAWIFLIYELEKEFKLWFLYLYTYIFLTKTIVEIELLQRANGKSKV